MSMTKIRITNPVALLREMARRRSARNANDQTVGFKFLSCGQGQVINGNGLLPT